MQSRLVFPSTQNRESITVQRVSSVEIESSWKLLTDRAVVVLPRNTTDFNKLNIKDLFRVGDKCEVWLGYNGDLVKEFEGYITRVFADVPFRIELEDEMWKLKQVAVNVSMKAATLPQLLNQILPSYSIDALDVSLGTVRFPNTTVAQVLKKLQEDFGLYAYMKGTQLVCGKVYYDDAESVDFGLEQNVVETNLKYQRAEDIKIKIRAVSTLSNGEKLTVEVGDADGELRQLSYYNITSESELKKLAELDLIKYRKDGYEGSITAFGVPYVAHGYKANITSSQYAERDGQYYVERVTKRFNDSPEYRQIIELGEEVSV